MKDKDLISVVVPIYNIENYVKTCVESLIQQSYKNLEILLINDGSTDNSAKVCQEYSNNSNVFLYTKKNGGLSDARNYGLNLAKGKYVAFVDGDDYVEPDYIAKLYEAIVSNNSEVAMCEYFEVDENKQILKTVNLNQPLNMSSISGKILLDFFYKAGGVVDQVIWNKLYDKGVFSKVKFAKGKYYEDGYIIAPLYWNVKKVSLVRQPLYNYVQRSDSIMHTKLSKKKIKDSEGTYQYRINFFKGKDQHLYSLAITDYKSWILNFATNYLLNNENNEYLDHLQSQYRKYNKLGSRPGIKYKVLNFLANQNLILAARLKSMYYRRLK